MPELPEVETTRRGIAPYVENHRVTGVVVRQPRLRWPVPDLAALLTGHRVHAVERRAKYLLLRFDHGSLIIHLGMSGSLRVLAATSSPRPHDHVDLLFGRRCLRLHDPRRFGAMLWADGDPLEHPRLQALGPEPLSDAFDADYLHACTRGRRVAIKSLLMDGKVVVGVGNIYATEALFHAGIHPARSAGRTLRDFVNETGEPGYFAQELFAYGRAGEPCKSCGATVRTRQIGQRASAYCPHCQR